MTIHKILEFRNSDKVLFRIFHLLKILFNLSVFRVLIKLGFRLLEAILLYLVMVTLAADTVGLQNPILGHYLGCLNLYLKGNNPHFKIITILGLDGLSPIQIDSLTFVSIMTTLSLSCWDRTNVITTLLVIFTVFKVGLCLNLDRQCTIIITLSKTPTTSIAIFYNRSDLEFFLIKGICYSKTLVNLYEKAHL